MGLEKINLGNGIYIIQISIQFFFKMKDLVLFYFFMLSVVILECVVVKIYKHVLQLH